ncbi:MAG: anthranilate/aminodeoxychorismate synthase component II [Chitinivibrionales bacterium]|nr:anthranilate/aminodeoxychorismate synthase component II [Chitinivibrionales bacterium]
MLLMIDNYDSFTFNLVQYIGEIYPEIQVYRNDKITPEEIEELGPAGIVISPGPGTPDDAGISVETVKKIGAKTPILGVCLGHQSIGCAFGGKVIRAPYLMHGKVSDIFHKNGALYKNIPSPFRATRYHSLILERKTLPPCFEITSETEDRIIMGIRHKKYPIEGIQFHPESILTETGKLLLENFIAGVI